MTIRSRTYRRAVAIGIRRTLARRMDACLVVVALVFVGCGSSTATASHAAGTISALPSANPATGFKPTGSLTAARALQTADLLSTGRVLIAGGGAPADGAKVELYDPTTGTSSPTGSLETGRYGATATVLSTGRVLIAGGWSEDPNVPVLASAELYDPASGTFAQVGSMTTPRAGHSATLLADGKVLITGGQIENDNVFSSLVTAELFDPSTARFSKTGSMTVARFNHTATLLPGGHVLITGGGGTPGLGGSPNLPSEPSLASAELYDPVSGRFTATGSMSATRDWHTATLLSTGHVLIAGGDDGSRSLASAELYDPATAIFSAAGSMAAGRYLQTATRLAGGLVLVAGGYADGIGSLGSAELYDPATDKFRPAGSMSDTRFEHTATLLDDGRVLIVAGASTDESLDDAARLATAELYQP
jgi:hypothetical protein